MVATVVVFVFVAFLVTVLVFFCVFVTVEKPSALP